MTRKPIKQGDAVVVMLGLEASEWLQGTFVEHTAYGELIITDQFGRDMWIKDYMYMCHQ